MTFGLLLSINITVSLGLTVIAKIYDNYCIKQFLDSLPNSFLTDEEPVVGDEVYIQDMDIVARYCGNDSGYAVIVYMKDTTHLRYERVAHTQILKIHRDEE